MHPKPHTLITQYFELYRRRGNGNKSYHGSKVLLFGGMLGGWGLGDGGNQTMGQRLEGVHERAAGALCRGTLLWRDAVEV